MEIEVVYGDRGSMGIEVVGHGIELEYEDKGRA